METQNITQILEENKKTIQELNWDIEARDIYIAQLEAKVDDLRKQIKNMVK